MTVPQTECNRGHVPETDGDGRMREWLYRLWQCTWGLPQTLAGALLYLRCRRSPHAPFHGALHTRWPRRDGLSLGMFIFTPDSGDDWDGRMIWHEYGHTFQSLLLGPLYLPVIGLPSALWCHCFREYRRRKCVPYAVFFTERWADRLGDKKRQRWSYGDEDDCAGYQNRRI